MRDPGRGGLRAARQLRAAAGSRGFLTMFMAFLLRENPIGDWSRPRCCSASSIGAAGLGNTLGIALRLDAASGSTPPLTVVLALLADAVVVLLAALFYGVLDPGAARPDRRAGPVAGQAVPRRDDPARRPRAGAGQRLRPQRHHAPAGLGARRLRRHRAARSNPKLGPGGRQRAWSPGRCWCWRAARERATVAVRRPMHADASASSGRSPAASADCRRRSQAVRAGQSSSSSASARSSLAVGRGGLAVGVPAVAVGLADAVEQPDQVLDDRRPSRRGFLRWACDWLRDDRRPARRGPGPGAPGRRGGPGRCRTRPGCRA